MLGDWTSLKSVLTNRGLSAQYTVVGSNYWIKAIDGAFEIECLLPTDTTQSSDSLDFVTNFKTAANQSLKTNVIQQLGVDSVTLCPFGTIFSAPANQITTYDSLIANAVYLKGGIMYSSPGNVGDTLTVQVIDKNNVVGLGGTPTSPTVLATYVDNWYVIPQDMNAVEDISLSNEVPAGLYLRFIYTNSSISSSTQVIVNMLAYKGTV